MAKISVHSVPSQKEKRNRSRWLRPNWASCERQRESRARTKRARTNAKTQNRTRARREKRMLLGTIRRAVALKPKTKVGGKKFCAEKKYFRECSHFDGKGRRA